MMDRKRLFENYLYSNNLFGSGKASSYLKALQHLSTMLGIDSFDFDDCVDIYSVSSLQRLNDLLVRVNKEKNKGKQSVWLSGNVPTSYLEGGFCSAALRSYISFLSELNQEDRLFEKYKNHQGDSETLVEKIDVEPEVPEYLVSELSDQEGREAFRQTKTRLNQNVFRKIILDIYNNTCCVTGLNIPQLNIASHIVPWSENEKSRLDPSNGLCLSATYDAAFDKNLISLDENYRVLVSKRIKDYYENYVVKNYFNQIEGKEILLPNRYPPNPQYLSQHREIGEF